MFPFIGVFDRVLSRIGASQADEEDYAIPRHLDRGALGNFDSGVAAVAKELGRYTQGASLMLLAARGDETALKNSGEHQLALDTLSQEIRAYTAQLFKNDLTPNQTNLLASLIEEEDFSASLTETLSQITRRVERQLFSDNGKAIVNSILDIVEPAVKNGPQGVYLPQAYAGEIAALRERSLQADQQLGWDERGAILTLLGSAERVLGLVQRIDDERKSVSREGRSGAATTTSVPGAIVARPA